MKTEQPYDGSASFGVLVACFFFTRYYIEEAPPKSRKYKYEKPAQKALLYL